MYAEYIYMVDASPLPAIQVNLEGPEKRDHIEQAGRWFAQEAFVCVQLPFGATTLTWSVQSRLADPAMSSRTWFL